MGVPACTFAECIDALRHHFELLRAHPGVRKRDLKRMLKALEATLEE